MLIAGSLVLAQTPPPAAGAPPEGGGSAAPAAPKPPSPLNLESYIRPPKVIEEAVLAPWHLNESVTNLDPDGGRWVRAHTLGLPRLADLAEPAHNLAGLQVDIARGVPRAWVSRPLAGLTIRSLNGRQSVALDIPAGMAPRTPVWSPDGRRLAFVGVQKDRASLCLADPTTGKVTILTDRPVNPVLEDGIFWKSDSSAVIAVLAPQVRPPLPTNLAIPTSPTVRVSDPLTNRIRTFASRLENIDDGALLKRHITGQLAVIDVRGRVSEIGSPGLIESVSPSPDFSAIRLTVVQEPFLYTYPFGSFVRRTSLISGDGKEIVELSKTQAPDAAPAARPNERRSLTWDPFGRGLIHLQKVPAGKDTKASDRIMLWKAPFSKDSSEVLFSSETDITSFLLLPDQKRALVTQTVNQETQVSLAVLGGTESKKLYSFKPAEFFSLPGSPVSKDGPLAGSVLRVSRDGSSFYMSGIEYSRNPEKEAPRPFVDRVALEDGKKERIWQSRAETYEQARLLDDDAELLLVTRQSPTEAPNEFRVTRSGGGEVRLTENSDRLPAITRLKKERVQVTRADGFKFWVEVTLPKFAANGEGKRAFFWFYPSEVRSQSAYLERDRTRNINAFTRYSAASPQLMALADFVVVEPDVPIVGTAERPNDTYVHQLRSSLYAIIDELDRRKLIDRRYLSLGGHSYGAFSTANAMVNTPFFKAGIAGAGNYNRTLTPFGFQAEPRRLWEGRDMYLDMSPILRADQITGALLMYHGAQDQNVGTFPINSYRMFDALEALGKPAALYVYPYEDHGQIALESRMDMWARWIAWLEEHIKLD
jgi:dipeptidyl aminopeptidase/acylaminoacyl peptidase